MWLVLVEALLVTASQPSTTPACPSPAAAPRLAPVIVVPAAVVTLARCVAADLDAGRWRDADRRLAQAQRAGIALPAQDQRAWFAQIARLDAMRRVDAGQWATLSRDVIAHEDALPWVGPLVRGVAAARSAWARQDGALLARARAELTRLEALAREAGPVSEEERARLVVQGAIAGAQYERDEMQLLLDAAHDLETRLLAGDVRRPPVVLAWELQADLLRITDRYAAASECYRALLVEWPRRVQARIGLADAYRRLGHMREADETLAQARSLWTDADAEARALLR
jgi:tetratricopeptide (TPR) repeat protein